MKELREAKYYEVAVVFKYKGWIVLEASTVMETGWIDETIWKYNPIIKKEKIIDWNIEDIAKYDSEELAGEIRQFIDFNLHDLRLYLIDELEKIPTMEELEKLFKKGVIEFELYKYNNEICSRLKTS